MLKGDPLGAHRVLEPTGALPQGAWKLDNRPEIRDDEVLISVRTLNIDAASFTQMEEEAEGDLSRLAACILDTVGRRGKMHNPVTGSGGMLVGTVAQVGPAWRPPAGSPLLRPGDRVATLVSLSLTPLRIDRIRAIRPERDQVEIDGQAILFRSGLYAHLPGDLPENLALAVLDVAGAPAQTARLVQRGQTVLVLGAGGKAGLLCLHQARRRAGPGGLVLAFSYTAEEAARTRFFADRILTGDARRPLEVRDAVAAVTGGQMADLTINCVSVPGTEMASILATKPTGTVYFFSMVTSFTAAALGAEGVGSPVTMIIGNGYTPGHAELALECLRESPELRRAYEEMLGL